MPKWLRDAVFYEIYPQSFKDSNGDGIGDFNGIIEKLDYIKGLGCNAIWMNPCYDSPFSDAGYDVRDYKKTAARYGSNDDLIRLFDEVHKRDMHILLDLVPGHTSEEHEWFKESRKAEVNAYSDRYIWTDSWFHSPEGLNYVAGESPRTGTYVLNF
ncbi:MAG: glycosylase, partial [Lachnospiraceae bacterium]|nr:glycosylase [Lachnospiraceae bacterium]